MPLKAAYKPGYCSPFPLQMPLYTRGWRVPWDSPRRERVGGLCLWLDSLASPFVVVPLYSSMCVEEPLIGWWLSCVHGGAFNGANGSSVVGISLATAGYYFVSPPVLVSLCSFVSVKVSFLLTQPSKNLKDFLAPQKCKMLNARISFEASVRVIFHHL